MDKHKDLIQTSEDKRDELHTHMAQTSEKMQEEAKNNQEYQDELLKQIEDLKAENLLLRETHRERE